MKRNLNSVPLLLLGLSLLFCPACKKKEQEHAPPPPGPAVVPQPAPKPQPPVQQQPSSAKLPQSRAPLDFRTRTDPFKPYVVAEPTPVKPVQPAPKKDLLPIQSYDLSKFRVAGIITGLKENKALILDPNGKAYVVQAGMVIGSNEGRITRITSSSIEVVETYREYKGKTKKRKIVLTLPKKR